MVLLYTLSLPRGQLCVSNFGPIFTVIFITEENHTFKKVLNK